MSFACIIMWLILWLYYQIVFPSCSRSIYDARAVFSSYTWVYLGTLGILLQRASNEYKYLKSKMSKSE
jgi:hypothetical protein